MGQEEEEEDEEFMGGGGLSQLFGAPGFGRRHGSVTHVSGGL